MRVRGDMTARECTESRKWTEAPLPPDLALPSLLTFDFRNRGTARLEMIAATLVSEPAVGELRWEGR